MRWIVLIPDPVTGLDAPLEDSNRQRREWIADDREAARALVKECVRPGVYYYGSVVSVVDWEARRAARQRSKLTHEPHESRGSANPSQKCWRCGGRTPSTFARYCDRHRAPSRRTA